MLCKTSKQCKHGVTRGKTHHDRTERPVVCPHTIQKRKQSQRVINDLDNVDNEAVIKMIINSRSPTMRHVSRTHRVALDWLFDRINLDPKIQIKYIDTKNQLANILTNENFTRDEWNHLLSLFDIIHFSSTKCSEVMSKRTQKRNQVKKESHSKVKTNDEFDCKGSLNSVIFCIRKPGENQI